MRLIDADVLEKNMYHEAFEKDTDLQRWDSGCWIRYRMFTDVLKSTPSAEPERCEDCGNFNKTMLLIPQPKQKRGEWTTEEVAEILARVLGDECACNFNGIDEWLPSACKYADTECPTPKEKHGCWIQFLMQGGADMRTKETDNDYERAVDQLEHDISYEPTFNQDDGSM